MKRNDARIILNLNLTDDELQERIHLAVEDYIDKYINSDKCKEQIEKRIASIIERRLNDYDSSWNTLPENRVFKYKDKDNLRLQEAISYTVNDIVSDYLNSDVVAKQILKKLSTILNTDTDE